MKLSVQESTLARLQVTLRDTEDEVSSLKDTVVQQKDDLHAGEMERRRLHNAIQELKASQDTAQRSPAKVSSYSYCTEENAAEHLGLSSTTQMSLFSLTNDTNLSVTLFLQGNIRVFCRVRPLVEGGLSKHIQLAASDNKTITLAKTEEVRILGAYLIRYMNK